MILTCQCREAKKYKVILASLTGLQTSILQGIEENNVSGSVSCREEENNYQIYNSGAGCLVPRAGKKQKICYISESKLIL